MNTLARLAPLALMLVLGGCAVEPFCLGCGPRDAAVSPLDAGLDAGPVTIDAAPLDAPACMPAPDGLEACNTADDDCDGRTDEDFDLQTNPRHCGACGVECRFDNAEGRCEAGTCAFVACFDGFVDLDATAGCEYACPVFPPRDEDCNGFDDDCDGEVDEPAELPAPPDGLCRTTPGTPCAAVRAVCAAREGTTTWFCDYPAEVEFDPRIPNGIALDEARCDGQDGDCDGLRDEAFPELGDRCDDGGRGACRDEGRVACDPADPAATRCDLTALPDPAPGAPSAEVCNAVDDDCDGIVDNADPTDPARVRDDMVHVVRAGLDFWIYRHEATRPDADETAPGSSSERACGRGAALPWTSIGHADAAAACAAAGHRLCTGAEWQAACEGSATRAYPYGASYQPDTCNGADHDAVPGGAFESRLVPTGASPMCLAEDGVLDLSGNAKEWTVDARGTSASGTPIHVVRGGSHQSPSFGLTCATDLARATIDTLLPSLGFRCCDDDGP